jgi:predicted Zn-dependent protease with MMP-like domain
LARKRIGTTWARAVDDIAGARKTFEQLVADALDSLPEQFQRRLANVEVIIEDGPGNPELLGLYHGIPQTDRGNDYSGVLPDVITIYRRAIESRVRTPEDLAREVRTTVLHEIAHHFGISDERLHELGMD